MTVWEINEFKLFLEEKEKLIKSIATQPTVTDIITLVFKILYQDLECKKIIAGLDFEEENLLDKL